MNFGNRFFHFTFILFLFTSSVNAEVHDGKADKLLNRYVVKFKTEASYAASFSDVSVMSIGKGIPQLNTAVMEFDSEEEAQQWASSRKDVEYIEQDRPVYAMAEDTPYGINLVHAMDIPEYVEGSGIKMCILDTGYAVGHPDLPNPNNGEDVTGTTGLCSNNPCDWNADPHSHGTHVAGTITATGDNNEGVVGVVKNNKMPLYIGRVLASNGGGSFLDVAAGALLCEENGANVINMSLGGGGNSAPQVFQDAVDTILDRSDRVLFVAAAGNGGNGSYLWPASMPEVMSVAAVDSNKSRASFSQYNNQVDISGPGVSTRSTMPNNGYGSKSGTSMATPHVAGVAAKVWSHAPHLTAKEIRTLLESTAEDLGTSGRDDYYGWGLVNALAAYQALPSTDAPSPSPLVCGDSLSETYLSKIREADIDLFAPSAYFRGDATKFISSSGETQLNSDKLCVDGATSYTGPIQLYDDGTHGDDVANDGVYSRDCVHYCDDKVDLSDFFGYAMVLQSVYSRLIVVDESLEGTVPYEVLNTPLAPDATAIASSHAFFFADVDRKYYPNFPMSLSPNRGAGPSGKNVVASALLSVFGDAFDFLTVTPLEKEHVGAIGGAGIYKWQHWDRRGGPMINNIIGEVDKCIMSVSGVPAYRLTGVINNGDVVNDTGGMNHELVHGVSGYSYHMNLNKARNGDNMHTPGACTTDHSSLQGPVWDWVNGYPEAIPASDPSNNKGIRIEPNDDCKQCPNWKLRRCCSFRYLDIPNTKDEMLSNPELVTMSPLMLYIAGMIKADDVPEDKRTYYCMGSDTDGGCGIDGDRKSNSMFASKYWREEYSYISDFFQASQRPECIHKVDDSDRSKVTSDYVSRFTLENLIFTNGGTRFPEEKFKVVRHAAIHLSSRLPSEAEIVFYTLLWRHHETEEEPWERLEEGRKPVEPWRFHTGGHSILYSRLHGIDCGEGGANVPSCVGNDMNVCEGYPCGAGAICKTLDGQPFCMCRDGYVGDGIECTFVTETSYDKRASAHELSQSGSFDQCFADNSDWTEFVSESSLPPYPGGQAPYSPTSCGTEVCRVGWRCNAEQNKCLPPRGSNICEKQSGLSKGKCLALGCCKWRQGECLKKSKRNKCPKPIDPFVPKTCTDVNTCCYFDCDNLELDNETQISQVGNCGYNCTAGIKPDINGVIHPELFLWPNIYITNGGQYGYHTGPMNIQGDDNNMFNRCMNQCFTGGGGGDDPKQTFLYKIKPDDTLLTKSCDWLSSRKLKTKRNICTKNAYNLSQRGYKSARIACPNTCADFQ